MRLYEVWEKGDEDYKVEVAAFNSSGAAQEVVEEWDQADQDALDNPYTVCVREVGKDEVRVWKVLAEVEVVYHASPAPKQE